KNPGSLIIDDTGRVGVQWQEDAFKYMIEGEKGTNRTISRRLLAEITGDESVSVAMNANILKHKDFGMYLSGKAKIFASHAENIQNELDRVSKLTHPNDKASQVALRRDELQDEMKRIHERAKDINLEWDSKRNMFMQRGKGDIPADTFSKIFDEFNISDKTKHDFDTAILELRASKVSNYSKMIDETGRSVLQVTHDKDGN